MPQVIALNSNFVYSEIEQKNSTDFIFRDSLESSGEIDNSIKIFDENKKTNYGFWNFLIGIKGGYSAFSIFIPNSIDLLPFAWAKTIDAYTNTEIKHKNPEAIMRFQSQFPEVKNYIFRAQQVVQKYFPGSGLELEVLVDHDSDTEFEEMFLHIQTTIPFKEALKLLKKVNELVFTTSEEDQLLFGIDIGPS